MFWSAAFRRAGKRQTGSPSILRCKTILPSQGLSRSGPAPSSYRVCTHLRCFSGSVGPHPMCHLEMPAPILGRDSRPHATQWKRPLDAFRSSQFCVRAGRMDSQTDEQMGRVDPEASRITRALGAGLWASSTGT